MHLCPFSSNTLLHLIENVIIDCDEKYQATMSKVNQIYLQGSASFSSTQIILSWIDVAITKKFY